jgi:hypothetical protein
MASPTTNANATTSSPSNTNGGSKAIVKLTTILPKVGKHIKMEQQPQSQQPQSQPQQPQQPKKDESQTPASKSTAEVNANNNSNGATAPVQEGAASAEESTNSTVPSLTTPIPASTPTPEALARAAAAAAMPTPKSKSGRVGSHQASWERNFHSLLSFKARFGDCLVPCKYKEDTTLSHWVEHQRKAKKKGKLAPDRIKRLDQVGFIWKVQPGMKAAANAKRSCIGVPTPQVLANRNKDAMVAAAAAALAGDMGPSSSSFDVLTTTTTANHVNSLHHPMSIATAGTESTTSKKIEVLLRTAAIKLGRDSNEVIPFVERLHKEWYYETHQLQGLDIDTLARYVPHGLARQAMKLIQQEPYKWGITQNAVSNAAGAATNITTVTDIDTTTSVGNKTNNETTVMTQEVVPL